MSTTNSIPLVAARFSSHLGGRCSGLAVLAAALSLGGCGRLLDGEEREGFGTVADAGSDTGDAGEDAGSADDGGENSPTCWDGEVQPGEICQTQGPDLPAGIDPCSLSVADLDDDGRPDLAVPNSNWILPAGSTHVTNILRGFGNGNFAAAVAYDAGAELPVGLATGDFDGDGDLDVATANNDANAAFVALNQGGMSFADASEAPLGTVASSIEAGDVNGDGVDDLLVATPEGLAVIVQDFGGGVQWIDMVDTGGGSPMHAELVDINGDGNLDIIAAVMDPIGEGDRVMIFRGAGDGSFPEFVSHPLSGDPWWVVAGDLNMDGDLDLAVADYGSNKISILLGNDQGGFSQRTELDVCVGPQSVEIADMNLDGASDLVVGCMESDRVEMWIQTDEGQFELARWWTTGLRPVSVQVADLNLDGVPDIAWANQYSDSIGMVLSHP